MYNNCLNTLTHTLSLNINILSCWNFLGCQHILMHILGSLFRIWLNFCMSEERFALNATHCSCVCRSENLKRTPSKIQLFFGSLVNVQTVLYFNIYDSGFSCLLPKYLTKY
jgi:hypothetical protein